MQVLVLNTDYTPLKVVPWRKAVKKLISEKVQVVEAYADKFIRSSSLILPFPAVVVRVGRYVQPRVKRSRKHVLARDAYTCQYCGARPRRSSGAPNLELLTLDHVVPQSWAEEGWVTTPWNGQRVRTTSWENLLTACESCNHSKANRLPAEAGLVMRKKPRAPNPIDLACMSIIKHEIQDEWKNYLPRDSPWRDYWDVELED